MTHFQNTSIRPGPRARLCIGAAAAAIFVLLPIEAGNAGILDYFRGSSKSDAASKPAKPAAKPAAATRSLSPAKPEPKSEASAPKSEASAKLDLPKPTQTKCDPAKFRLIVDVGHTRKSDGAMSARNVPEYQFNLHLAQRLVEHLKSEGFSTTRLLVTEGGARPSLGARVGSANNWHADLFLSIHHDSVPDKMMESWEFEGKKSHYSDRFSGYGLFVSKSNPDFDASMQFAHLIGKQMRARGIKFADQYTMPIMGKYRHDLLDREAGVYRYDHLIVLMTTRMPAVLLEAGSIINRDEELQMASAERQDMTVNAVTTAVKQYCDPSYVPETIIAGTPGAAEPQKKADR